MNDEITVGMGRLYVVDKPATLTCLGLGSCVALMLYDPKTNICGLAHVMLPDSSKARFCEIDYSSILLEKDEFCIKTLKSSLTSMGYEIKAVSDDLDEALKRFREINPYLFLLDANLTQNSGNNVLDEIFKINRSANVVITNINSSMDYIDFLSKGALDFISKPVTRDKVSLILDIVNSLKYIRFADVALEKMIKRMIAAGASQDNLKAKLAGGANMFNHSQVDSRNIGEENHTKIDDLLKEKRIRVVSKDVGGNIGRTVRFNTQDFSVSIKSRDGEKNI